MKHLQREASLQGKCELISITELRARPGDVLAQVELEKTFVITRQGREIAVLSRVPGEQLIMRVDAKGKTTYRL